MKVIKANNIATLSLVKISNTSVAKQEIKTSFFFLI
jgi:hypothetical protein